jgi:tetratricopeptide (TPR) repeat protein
MTACSFGGTARRHFNQGVANYNSGNYEQAIADYNKAIELDPNYALAYNNRWNACADSGDLEQAIADFERYLELAPHVLNRAELVNMIDQLKSELAP